MSKPELIKKSGRVFIASAAAFATLLTGWDPIAIPGSLISAVLLAVAMSALRSGYRDRIGFLGRNALILGMLGPVFWAIGLAFMAVMGEKAVGEGLWVLLFAGPAFSLLGLTLFGLTALSSKPMPRLNWLPLLTGIWYPVIFILFSIYDISRKGVFPEQYVPLIALTVMIQVLTLCVLGSVLVDDSSKEMAMA